MATLVLAALMAAILASTALAGSGAATGMRDRWVREHFASASVVPAARVEEPEASSLVVPANHGPILRNGRPDGRRIKLGDTEYAHGLICHAPSRVVVCLPQPAAKLDVTIGVDAHAGGGSVVFAVRCGAREVFRSPVKRGGEQGTAASVNLGGVREFTLVAEDAGDGIASDHADWAEATVTLADGSAVRVADLPEPRAVTRPRAFAAPPFSFVYGGRHSDALLGRWRARSSSASLGRGRTRRTQTYRDPVTGLEAKCVAVVYADYPVVEWTVTLRNTGKADTPIVEGLQAVDAGLLDGAEKVTLHRFVGSPCQENDYQPIEEKLQPGSSSRISAAGGRPTNSDLCYFNVEGERQGVIVGLGWPGQWAATFSRHQDGGTGVVAGQERTRFVLHPGEEVRTPLVALLFYNGSDWLCAQNVWRRWMNAHNLPRPAGKPIATHYAGCWGNPLPRAEEEIAQIRGVAADGVRLDYWFIDAGWYPCRDSWVYTGTWEPDPVRFPKGLGEVGDVLRGQGVQFIVWFEPERVTAGSWLAENRPQWVLGGSGGGLFDMGNAEARAWMTDRVDALMRSGGIDVFRTDFNMDPLPYWQANDADDRIGMTENAYVRGLLAFWDELLRRKRGRWIDTCASGGRRNDLETLRRAVPLLRSDWAVVRFDAVGATGQQAQTWAISLWMPYHGTGAPSGDPYIMRSSYVPAFRMGWDATDPKRDPGVLRKAVAEFRCVAPMMLGDFYPLTPYSLAHDAWIAWQYDVPEKGEGAVQVFRREASEEPAKRLRLRGLNRDAMYLVEDLDAVRTMRCSGAELMDAGLGVVIGAKPGSALLLYRRIR